MEEKEKEEEKEERRGFYSKNFKLHGEVRGVKKRDNSFTKDGKEIAYSWLVVKVLDDDEGSVMFLVDKNVSHIDIYKRGTVGNFTLRIDFEPKYAAGRYDCTMYLIGFEKDPD